MMLSRPLVALAAAALLSGCIVHPAYEDPHIIELKPRKQDFAEELAPGELALEKVTDLAEWPDLAVAIPDRAALIEAIDQSLAYLAKPSSKRYYPYLDITHDRVRRSLEAFKTLAIESPNAQALEDALRSRFELYRSKGRSRSGEVLFTAYCEPIYDASRTPDATFRYPLYQRPLDLESTEEGKPLGRRTPGGKLVPYFTRAQIDRDGALRGKNLELVYLKNPFEAYLVHVQGSARLRLVNEGNRLLPVGYAGKTDRPYRSLGKALIRDGKIAKADMSLGALKQYFGARPDEMLPYLDENQSYVFFRVAEGGPFGSIGARVTAECSIATDKSVFPRAALAFADCTSPRPTGDGGYRQMPFRRFMLDQDTGGAIRSAGRCDLFLGTGPEAERRAGATQSVGGLYYLFLK